MADRTIFLDLINTSLKALATRCGSFTKDVKNPANAGFIVIILQIISVENENVFDFVVGAMSRATKYQKKLNSCH
jgi:hypothetical protein